METNFPPKFTDEQIAQAIAKTAYTDAHPSHQHYDCVRICFEWLDAQKTLNQPRKTSYSHKHAIQSWGGRYVSSSDVEVAVILHSRVEGTLPYLNVSKNLIWPDRNRLVGIGEAGLHRFKDSQMPTYWRYEAHWGTEERIEWIKMSEILKMRELSKRISSADPFATPRHIWEKFK